MERITAAIPHLLWNFNAVAIALVAAAAAHWLVFAIARRVTSKSGTSVDDILGICIPHCAGCSPRSR